MKHSLSLRSLALSAAAAALAAGAYLPSAFAQATPGQQGTQVERFQRQIEQIQRSTRFRANPEIPPGQRALIDYGGYLTFNFLAIDDITQNTHILRQYDLVGFGRVNFDNAHEFFLRARTSYRDWNEGDDFDGEGDEFTSPTVEQAYYRFDLNRYMNAYRDKDLGVNNVVGTFGRQFIYWGNGLVFADRIDGGNIDITLGNWGLQFMGGATPNDNVDFDSSRPDFDEDTQRNFWGGMLSYQLGRHKPYVYFLGQDDKNENETLVAGDVETDFDYESRYIGVGMNGSIGDRIVYGVEGVYEFGRGLSNSFTGDIADPTAAGQTTEDIEAWALDVRLDYLFADPRRTRLSLEGILASGDDDRFGSTSNTFGGNASGTDDEAFNAFGLINTGLAFAPNVSNLAMLRVGASTFPFGDSSFLRKMQVGLDVLFYGKFDSDAPIDETTSDDFYLGTEPDLFLNWQITSDLTLALRYGVFFPGPAIENDEHPRHFFFTGLTFSF